jgi:hypothetical protein
VEEAGLNIEHSFSVDEVPISAMSAASSGKTTWHRDCGDVDEVADLDAGTFR